jgi:hypothetical protein
MEAPENLFLTVFVSQALLLFHREEKSLLSTTP